MMFAPALKPSFRLIVPAVLLSLMALTGCNPDNKATITGTVTFDGEPIETGTISFEDPNGDTATAEGIIAAGKYEVKDVPLGTKKVKVTGQRKTGKTEVVYAGDPNSPVIDVMESYIPPQFNDQTTLTYDVTKSDTMDFPLQSK